MYAVIPDIHGDYYRMAFTLQELGFRKERHDKGKYLWTHPQDTKAVFLGDFIDGGKSNARVIEEVRLMEKAGSALAIMGNHELNALLFHTPEGDGHRDQGSWLRDRTADNRRQHQTFLDEYDANLDGDFGEPKDRRLKDVLDWFQTLPLFLDLGRFRVVHAQWDQTAIDEITRIRGSKLSDEVRGAYLKKGDLPAVAKRSPGLGLAVDRVLKGMEIPLPKGTSFIDFHQKSRESMRVKWWANTQPTYRGMSLSVPDPHSLPETRIDDLQGITQYLPPNAPVFVGHYKMHGTPSVDLSEAAACLDYPKTACAYLWESGDAGFREGLLSVF